MKMLRKCIRSEVPALLRDTSLPAITTGQASITFLFPPMTFGARDHSPVSHLRLPVFLSTAHFEGKLSSSVMIRAVFLVDVQQIHLLNTPSTL